MSTNAHPVADDPPPLDETGRERLRRARVASRARWYSPWLHLATTVGSGAGLAALALTRLRDLRAFELLAVPAVLLFCNAVEWRAHRGLLHRRVPRLEAFYDRHTPVHHRVFVEHDMAIRSPWELGFVLIPWYGLAGVFALTSPVAMVLAWVGTANLAALFVATAMLYMLCYELLHLTWHLPPDGPIGRLPLVARLRRHHAVHHRPELMRSFNFNVTVPLWDVLHGTAWRDGPRDDHPHQLALERRPPHCPGVPSKVATGTGHQR